MSDPALNDRRTFFLRIGMVAAIPVAAAAKATAAVVSPKPDVKPFGDRETLTAKRLNEAIGLMG